MRSISLGQQSADFVMPSRFGYLHAIGGIVLGLVLLVFGSGDALNEFRLRRAGIVVDAEVQNWRTRNDDFMQLSHEVQYVFQLPGDKNIYTRTDSTQRANLWSTLPEEVWNGSKKTRKLSVVYLASNPNVNRPEQPAGFVTADLAVAVLFGAILTVVSLALLFFLVYRQKRYVEI